MISGNHWRALYSETRYETMAMCAKEMMIDKKFSPEGAVIWLHFLADHVSLNPAEIKEDDWLVDIFLHNVENTACWRLLRPYPFFFEKAGEIIQKKCCNLEKEIMKVLSRKFDLVKKRGSPGFLAEEVGHIY